MKYVGEKIGPDHARSWQRPKSDDQSRMNKGGFTHMNTSQHAANGRTSRRRFLGTAAGSLAAGAVGGPLVLSRPAGAAGRVGANDRIGSARSASAVGRRLLLQQLPEARRSSDCATAICHGPEASRPRTGRRGPSCRTIASLLDRQDVDAVIVATGEFQRVLPCIHACQAGKDVYAEKPLTLYIREGRALVECRAALQPHLAGRHATAFDGDEPRRLRIRPQRRPRQDPRSPGASTTRGPRHRPRQPFPGQPVPRGSTGTFG